jgi:hypothetical protein
MAWIGKKRLALVPLFRTNAHPPDQVPADWEDQILRRMLFDPMPGTSVDRSLRAYIHAASSGQADLDAVVMPRMSADQQDVPVGFLEPQIGAQLRAQGFDAAAIVMLGGPGAGTAEASGFWARFVMVEGVGVWAMEFMHVLTGFGDLYPFNGNMSRFDEMACSCGSHPSAYTKAAIGWLDWHAVAQHTVYTANYDLHSVGLVQPPPTGRVAAVRIGSLSPYLMVEARQRVDQFDSTISSEGVIVYRVQTTNPLGWPQNAAPVVLLTPTALMPGQTFNSNTGIQVHVTRALSGGFSVSITDPTDAAIYTIQQKSNGRFVDAHEIEGKDFGMVSRPAQNNDTQRWVIIPLGNNTYTMQQKSNGRFVDAHEIQQKDFAVVTRPQQHNNTQRWVFNPLGNDEYTIKQLSSGRFLDAHEIEPKDFAIVTRPAQNNDTQRWVIKHTKLPGIVVSDVNLPG